jgi:hypothetical protein
VFLLVEPAFLNELVDATSALAARPSMPARLRNAIRGFDRNAVCAGHLCLNGRRRHGRLRNTIGGRNLRGRGLRLYNVRGGADGHL